MDGKTMAVVVVTILGLILTVIELARRNHNIREGNLILRTKLGAREPFEILKDAALYWRMKWASDFYTTLVWEIRESCDRTPEWKNCFGILEPLHGTTPSQTVKYTLERDRKKPPTLLYIAPTHKGVAVSVCTQNKSQLITADGITMSVGEYDVRNLLHIYLTEDETGTMKVVFEHQLIGEIELRPASIPETIRDIREYLKRVVIRPIT